MRFYVILEFQTQLATKIRSSKSKLGFDRNTPIRCPSRLYVVESWNNLPW